MFTLESEFSPCGDQPKAIEILSKGVMDGRKSQVLLGVTGSGKTYTMANIIKNVKKPALILAHNKTLAAQLYQEFKAFFPKNAVEYFVSYYDYYQPEAYLARTDTYIEKDLSINEHIEKLRLSATRSLLERDDVIIVSSVSCIYGLGMPDYYDKMKLTLELGQEYRRDDVLFHLVELHYKRNDFDLARSAFRVRGDVIDIVPAYEEDMAYRIEFFGDEVERLSIIDPLTNKVLERIKKVVIYPGSHHVTPEDVRMHALDTIKDELDERMTYFEKENKLIERQRIEERTKYDLEMIKEMGFCKGVENYSRHFGDRLPGSPPACLMNYFKEDFLLFVDESHQTLPQVHAMYNGDRARKNSLIEFGFRLPSAYDNRPLKFEEFHSSIKQVIYVSATPGEYEVNESGGEVVQQIIRPTGLLDPIIEVKPATDQVDDCLEEIRKEIEKGNRVLVTTLTKKLSEDLSRYLEDIGVKAKYLHSDIDTLERIQIISDLRVGKFDVLVGINLLREGLDIPEVALVAILDADKEGFLRSATALTQTCGRAARNENGRVIMYADKTTKSMQMALDTTKQRREIQDSYNKKHGITPKSIKKKVSEDLTETFVGAKLTDEEKKTKQKRFKSAKELADKIKECESLMKQSAKDYDFEEAAKYRDLMRYYSDLQLLEDNPK